MTITRPKSVFEPLPVPSRVPFALSQVRLLDGPFRRAMRLNGDYLLALEPDRLLAGFRNNAGLPEKAVHYGGWESRGLEGHSLGHYLSACAMMSAATGDDHFRQRVDYCVDELAACQSATPEGHLAGMPHGREIFAAVKRGEIGVDGGFNLNHGWVPWYNQHKLFAGLRDAYLFTSNYSAKQVLMRLGEWAIDVCRNLNDVDMQVMLGVEHGGMMETLADLSAITGDPKYLAMAERFWHKAVLDPLSAGRDEMTGLHANTQVPKLLGAARLYELTGDVRYRTAADTFWHAVVGTRSFVTGSNSDREHFFPLGEEAAKLGPENGETCNVYNMLKLTSHLAEWTGRADCYDYYERALFNHVLGSIDPDSGMTTYFQSLEPGRFKVYGTPTDAFWCCTGTGMENHAKYGADIFTHAQDGRTLDVNLFIASELSWKQKGITLRHETDFPQSDTTTITLGLDRPVRLALRVRVPGWADKGIFVTGAIAAHGKAGSGYVTLDRTWQDGDKITVRLPMTLRLHRAADDATVAAVLYGPIVLAADLGREDMPVDNVADHTQYDHLPVPAVPMLVTNDSTLGWLHPIAGSPLHFETRGAGHPYDVKFAPVYAIHHRRYAVYVRLFNTAQHDALRQKLAVDQKAAQELAARTVDEIIFGEQQAEQEHGIKSELSRTGRLQNRPWRDAAAGGFFSVQTALCTNRNHLLRCTYWGNDAGRTFDIVVDGRLLATESLNAARPEQFFEIDYPLPAAIVGPKSGVTVEFRPHTGSIVGRVFGCKVLLDDSPAERV